MEPESGWMTPSMSFMRVDLPPPLGPMMPRVEPRFTWRVMCWSRGAAVVGEGDVVDADDVVGLLVLAEVGLLVDVGVGSDVDGGEGHGAPE